jgi:hypothetical protein
MLGESAHANLFGDDRQSFERTGVVTKREKSPKGRRNPENGFCGEVMCPMFVPGTTKNSKQIENAVRKISVQFRCVSTDVS